MGDENFVQLNSISKGQTVYVASDISGSASAAKVVFAIYQNNSLIAICSQDYIGNATYGMSYVLPDNINELSAKVFVIKDYGSMQPFTENKDLQFNTYTITQ